MILIVVGACLICVPRCVELVLVDTFHTNRSTDKLHAPKATIIVSNKVHYSYTIIRLLSTLAPLGSLTYSNGHLVPS